MSEPSVARLQQLAQHLVDGLGNVGVVIAIDAPGRARTYVEAGHRDLARTAPAGHGDLFQIGSQTKLTTALAILLLARDGRLRLTDKVRDLLDVAVDARIEVQHLISNSAGLGEYTDVMLNPFYETGTHMRPDELVTLARLQGQIFEPGLHFDYCNTGFVLAAMLVDAVSGMSYADFVTARVFRPLGLHDTHLGNRWSRATMLRGYFRGPRDEQPVDMGEADDLSWGYGAGDVVSTLDDMLRLFGRLFEAENAIGLTFADLTRVVRPSAPRPKFSSSLGAEYGFGIEAIRWTGPKVWGHRGGTLGYSSSTWIDPAARVGVATCVTRVLDCRESGELANLRYPGGQLIAAALSAGYALADRTN